MVLGKNRDFIWIEVAYLCGFNIIYIYICMACVTLQYYPIFMSYFTRFMVCSHRILMKHHVSYCATALEPFGSQCHRMSFKMVRYSSLPHFQSFTSTCHLFSTKDTQKHELVGRILQEQDNEQWEAVFESAALQRFRERSIRFVEMSGRENELKLDPFERLWM